MGTRFKLGGWAWLALMFAIFAFFVQVSPSIDFDYLDVGGSACHIGVLVRSHLAHLVAPHPVAAGTMPVFLIESFAAHQVPVQVSITAHPLTEAYRV